MSTKRHIVIDDVLWKEAKIAAAHEDTTVSGLVAAALTQWLAKYHDGPTREAVVTPLRKIENTDPLWVNTSMKLADIERRTAPLPAGPSFGHSQAAPKPLGKGK